MNSQVAFLPPNGTGTLGVQNGSVLVPPGSRVCNRCSEKKIRCDMGRPACSRCRESQRPCVYSGFRRKPGPRKGTQKRAKAIAQPIKSTSAAAETAISQDPGNVSNAPSYETPSEAQGLRCQTHGSTAEISTAHERQLLESFFDRMHSSIPLFHRDNFLMCYHTQAISTELVRTIAIITSKVLGTTVVDSTVLESLVNGLLNQSILEGDDGLNRLTLNKFRQATLIAYFSFHQFPGESAWMRIGHLTRKALQYGLHQLDGNSQDSLSGSLFCAPEELDDWRRVWWCIFCLDSYSNITAATPFAIDMESIVTALPCDHPTDCNDTLALLDGSIGPGPESLAFLPSDGDGLWMAAKAVMSMSNPSQRIYGIHIITTVLIREAATIRRLRAQNPSGRLRARLTILENQVSAIRLALPSRYLSPSRDSLQNETSAQHHARLITLLHIEHSRTFASIPAWPEQPGADFLERWSMNFEFCEKTVEIVKNWDPAFIPGVDPAICFVILMALILLHVHRVCGLHNQPDLDLRVGGYIDVLRLFLDQFGTFWALPKTLIASFEQFSMIVVGPLSPQEIGQIMRHLQCPLGSKWLSLIAAALSTSRINEIDDIDFPGIWNVNGWENTSTPPTSSVP